MTAYPTHSLVLEGEWAASDGSQQGDGDLLGSDTRGRRYSLNLRTEVVPGVRLDLYRSFQSGSWLGGHSSSGQWSGDLAAQVTGRTFLRGQWSQSRNDLGATFFQRERAGRVTLSSRLSTTTELFGDVNLTSQTLPESRSRFLAVEAGLTHQPMAALSVSGSYSFTRRRDAGAGTVPTDTIHSLRLDGRWSPEARWSLNGGLSVSRRRDRQTSLSLNPYAEVRWDPSSDAAITVRYYAQQLSERFDGGERPFGENRLATGLSGRVTYQLSPQDGLQLSYDAIQGLGSSVTGQKTLQVSYIRSL
jgi:hypothetical protein